MTSHRAIDLLVKQTAPTSKLIRARQCTHDARSHFLCRPTSKLRTIVSRFSPHEATTMPHAKTLGSPCAC